MTTPEAKTAAAVRRIARRVAEAKALKASGKAAIARALTALNTNKA